jgi:hypothetical protein
LIEDPRKEVKAMRRMMVGAVAVAMGAAAWAQDGEAAGPRLVVDPPVVDLGRMLDVEDKVESVRLRNDGDADLLIKRILSSCTCTAVSIGEYVGQAGEREIEVNLTLTPGEEIDLNVTFSPIGRSHEYSQPITIISDDPQTPRLVVQAKAWVDPLVRVDPRVLDFGRVERGQTVQREVTVTGRTEDFNVSRMSAGTLFRNVSTEILGLEEVEEHGQKVRRVRIMVTLDADRAPGPLEGQGSIRTNDPRRMLVGLMIRGSIFDDLIAPAVVRFGTNEAGSEVKQTFTLKSRSGRSFRVVGIQTVSGEAAGERPASVRWTARPTEGENGASEHEVTVTLPNSDAAGSFRGELIITTDLEGEEEARIPYNGIIRVAQR